MILDPPEDDPKTKEAVKAGRQRKVFRFLAIGGGAAAAAVVIYENHGHKRMVSPDRP